MRTSALLLAGLVAACGEATGPGGEPLRPGTQVLRRGNGAEPVGLDPHRAEGTPSGNILRDLYEGLVATAPDGSPVPGAATA